MAYGMRVYVKNIPRCIAMLFALTAGTSAADKDYILGKEEDKNLLTLSIVFVLMSIVALLVSIVISVVIISKKMKRSRKVGLTDSEGEHPLEEQEQRHQRKINGPGSGIHQSTDNDAVYQSVEYEQPNGGLKNQQGNPPDSEKGQMDNKESEKQKTLSSFHNPAYEASVPYGLDKEVDFKPVTSDGPK